jgi:predicted NACHT family NTPase
LIEFVSDSAGLLTARGIAVYSFPHRTFQEYLAACRLTGAGFPDEVAELALADGDRWREVTLLAGAKAARGTASAAQTVIENNVLAQVSERNRSKAERVRQWLLAPVDRAAAGDALCVLGDNRPGVGVHAGHRLMSGGSGRVHHGQQ